jgi:hypothetical protein
MGICMEEKYTYITRSVYILREKKICEERKGKEDQEIPGKEGGGKRTERKDGCREQRGMGTVTKIVVLSLSKINRTINCHCNGKVR